LQHPDWLALNETGNITPANFSTEIYTNSATCPLYGPESQGVDYLITGGSFCEVIQAEGKSITTSESVFSALD
jgi:hypothetical protein